MGLRAVASVVALTAALVGCAREPQAPSTLPSLTAAPSPTPSATPTPSAISAATPEGAVEFARYFYGQVELAYARKDPELVSRLSADGCSACERFVASISRLRDRNERTEGLIYDISFAQAPATDGTKARVDVIYSGPEVIRYDSHGQVVNREPAAVNAEEQVNLVRSPAGGWLVAEILRT
jgi:hypothetical protein